MMSIKNMHQLRSVLKCVVCAAWRCLEELFLDSDLPVIVFQIVENLLERSELSLCVRNLSVVVANIQVRLAKRRVF